MHFIKSLFVPFLIGFIFLSSSAFAAYIDNGDGTVTDMGTGLMWQKAMPTGTYTWEQALAYCENLILNNDGEWTNGTANASGAKYTDWRLPTAKELASIVDTTRYSPAIDPTYFPSTVANETWSSTTLANALNTAWYVNFNGGFTYTNLKIYARNIRAVRLGQSGSFVDLTLWPVPDTGQITCSDGTVSIPCPDPGQAFYGQDASYSINTPVYTKFATGCTPLPDNATTWDMVRDEVTGLMWENKTDDGSIHDKDNTYTWYDNNSATNGGDAGTPGDGTDTMDFIRTLNTATYGGVSDWRMPTEKELQSIVDYGVFAPSINMYFPNTVSGYYWSATTAAYSSQYAWYVVFNGGFVYYGYNFGYNKSNSFYVRAVRGPVNMVIAKSGAGAGTVTSADDKIDCGSNCIGAYSICSDVTLTATAASGSTFSGWSGGECSGTGGCTVTMHENLTVTATFDLIPTTTTTAAVTTTTTTIGGGVTTTTTIDGTTTTTTISGRKCPIIKALGENNQKLENLRNFRDSKLATSAVGRRITQIYYNNADSINDALERSPALRAAARSVLEVIAPLVGKN
jgi:hypothetical protein